MSMARNLMRRAVVAGGGGDITSPSHPNLLAMYTMDNISGATLFDESANSADGTITGATVVSGHIGDALRYDGNNDSTSLPVAELAGLNTGAISVWMVATGDDCRITFSNIGNSNKFLVMGVHNGVSSPGIWIYAKESAGATGQVQWAGGGTVSTTQYVHVVIQPNAAQDRWEGFLNGTLVTLEQIAGTHPTLVGMWWGGIIGLNSANINLRPNPVEYTSGDVDMYRLFDRRLTQAEVNALYNGGVGA